VKAFAWAVTLCVTLAACDSVEERAEERYQSALALIAEGDFDRAIVELRSVFQLNGRHIEARRTLAEVLLNEQGNVQGAYSQYLRLAEQEPDDLDIRIVLAELAFTNNNWDELERHGSKAEELAPDDPRVQALGLTRAYRNAALEEDNSARRALAVQAEEMTAALPENTLLRNLMIDNSLRDGEMRTALVSIDWLLEQDPDNARIWRQRTNVLAQLRDFDALEVQLREMVTRFDNDDTHKATLIRFYMSRQEPDKAEAFLRELAAASGADDIGPRVDLIRFLTASRGAEAGRVEVDAAIAEFPDENRFKVLQAGMDYVAENQTAAIATMESVLDGAEPSDENQGIKVTLARMLLGVGNEVGARARVEEVLAENAAHPDALKMLAAWQIQSDDTDAAISGLRTALDQAPEDADALTLMAQAYTRGGRAELARDFLALAVDASGNAPAETVRYARVLQEEESFLPAEDILLPALRLAPENVSLLLTLGQVYLGLNDNGRTEQVIATLRALDDPQAQQAAVGLEAERINRSSGTDEALSYLEGIANSTDATISSKVSLVRVRLRTGDNEGALGLARQIQSEDPDNEDLQSVLAAVEAVNGNLENAEALYQKLLDANPNRSAIWLEMSRLKVRQGLPDEAEAVVERGLAALPNDVNLMWARASTLERNGDIDGAISIYDQLYENNSSSIVVANNLASLITTYRSDAESLERAWTIARRFRDAQAPALQDTYGWILHRRGEREEALSYLENAAARMPNEPLVQFHLAEIYIALERPEDALAAYRAVIAATTPADNRDQVERARTQITALSAATLDQ